MFYVLIDIEKYYMNFGTDIEYDGIDFVRFLSICQKKVLFLVEKDQL